MLTGVRVGCSEMVPSEQRPERQEAGTQGPLQGRRFRWTEAPQ